MPGAWNQPRCGVCGQKQVKNGKTSAGRTRWRCKQCGSSQVRHRADQRERSELTAFHAWVLTGRLPQGSPRSFRRHRLWCWNIEVPQPPRTGVIHDVVMLDGTYFQGWCLLVALSSEGFVVGWQWCDREKSIAWQALLERLVPPQMVVIDGGAGLYSALAACWPEVAIQRCYFHIQATITRHLTRRPRLTAGKELLALTRALMRVRDLDEAAAWMGQYAAWEARWKNFLAERAYAKNGATRPVWASRYQNSWYVHRDLRSARTLYRRLIREGSLFTWLTLHEPAVLPRTTSPLEGGVNQQVKELLRRHRGIQGEHARRAVEWLLNSKTERPYHIEDLARPEHHNAPAQRTQPREEPDTPTGHGTAFSWEDGAGIQHGWAGRSHH